MEDEGPHDARLVVGLSCSDKSASLCTVWASHSWTAGTTSWTSAASARLTKKPSSPPWRSWTGSCRSRWGASAETSCSWWGLPLCWSQPSTRRSMLLRSRTSSLHHRQRAYIEKDILRMKIRILSALKFDLGRLHGPSDTID